MSAMRETLSGHLQAENFAHAIPLANSWAHGVKSVIERHELGWSVQDLGCRAEYWFCPPPRNGADAAAAIDSELEAFLHLWHLNRGQLLTPFHNMALFTTQHTQTHVDEHTSIFGEAIRVLTLLSIG